MATPHLIKIGPKERAWAQQKCWQRFWGTFELQESTGLYVEQGSSQTNLKNLARAFQKLPEELKETARDWRVTFNFAQLCTASGNSSTFYADFSRSNREAISPHVEMGSTSLEPAYIVPHLTHELGHLYWRTRSSKEREQYRQFLKESCKKGTVEITEYVQERYTRFATLSRKGEKAFSDAVIKEAMERWVEESFCDTIALLVDPAYPSRDSESTVDLGTRRLVIFSIFGLQLPAVQPGKCATAMTQ